MRTRAKHPWKVVRESLRRGQEITLSTVLGIFVFLSVASAQERLPQFFPLEFRDNELVLRLRSASRSAGCEFGEINEVDQERAQGKRTFRLILSVEPLIANSFPSRSIELTTLDLKREFLSTLHFPKPAEPTYVLLSLCSDWKGKPVCVGKPLRNLEEYFVGNDPEKKRIRISGSRQGEEIFAQALLKLTPDGAVLLGGGEPEDLLASILGRDDSAARAKLRELSNHSSGFFSVFEQGVQLNFRFRSREDC